MKEDDDLYAGKKIKCATPGCENSGYYRYGICQRCRPLCYLCNKPIMGAPKPGRPAHTPCLDAARRTAVGEYAAKPRKTPHVPV